MKKTLTITAAVVLALGSLTFLEAQGHGGHGFGPDHGRHMGNPLEHLTESLKLTDAQKAQVQPILDQANPQIAAIHKEAMEKMRTVMENTTAQIRPILTAEQQQKLESLKQAHQKMREAAEQMHDVENQ
jgi:Spy/CpxP family protein refolding chaperone